MDSQVTIAIDASALTGSLSGIPRYIYELIYTLGQLDAPEKFVALQRKNPAEALAFPGVETVAATMPLWLTAFVPYTLIKKRCRLVHFPYPALPPWLPCRSLITMHDLGFVRNPEWFTQEMLDVLRRSWLPALRKTHHILCYSDFTKSELLELFHVPPEKITVVYLGGGEKWRCCPEQNNLPHSRNGRPYILAVGTLQPRKNYVRLIQAFAAAGIDLHDFELCIVGSGGWNQEDLTGLAKELGVSDRVILPGAVNDDELLAWYHHATTFAFVSLYEGFGLPLIEAFAQGIPCVTSNSSSLMEIAGDAAVLVDPLDVDSIAQGLVRATTDTALRAKLREKCMARAAEFTWERCAQETLQVYRTCL